MIFDTLRRSRHLKLAALFGFAAASATMHFPRETPELAELRQLTRSLQTGTLSATDFVRMTDLTEQLADDPTASRLLTNSGLICGHASGTGGQGGGLTTAACPLERRRREQGDLSHLLVFHHWL